MQLSSIDNYRLLYSQSTSSLSVNSTKSQQLFQNAKSISESSSNEDSVALSKDYYDFKSFMDKVKNGTVTDSDLEDMQEQLTAAEEEGAMPPMPPSMMPPPMMTSESASTENEVTQIASFLEKVKSGTVTDEDLQSLQEILAEMEVKTQSTTSETETSTDSLSFESFLEKVKNGTVTDSDIEDMKELLSSIPEQDKMPPPKPPEELSVAGTVDAAGEFLNLRQAMTAFETYLNGLVTEPMQTSQDVTA